MEQRRFVTHDQQTSTWQVGSSCLTVGAVFMRRRPFLSNALRHMQNLSQRLGEAVNLGVLDDSNASVLLLQQTHARRFWPGLTAAGSRVSWHASAMGKVLLATRPHAEREKFLNSPNFPRFTVKTIVEPRCLQAELHSVSMRGHAIDDEESSMGKRCIAAPVFNELGECIAAVSVSSDKRRLPDSILPRIANILTTMTSEITAGAGGFSPTRHSLPIIWTLLRAANPSMSSLIVAR